MSEKEINEINAELDRSFKEVIGTISKLDSKTDEQLEKLLVTACEAVIANKTEIVKLVRKYCIQIEIMVNAMGNMMKVFVPAMLMIQSDTERVLKDIKRSAISLFIHKSIED